MHGKKAMRNHLIVAALLVIEELVVGTGIGCMAILISAVLLVVGVANWHKNRNQLVLAAVYALSGIASFLVIQINWLIAESRSKPVIAACEQFHKKHQRYPRELSELVPEFIPALPHAGFTLMSWRFFYSPVRPAIGFAVMFHGMASYDFQTGKWGTNE
jgi:hypothetical protein